jgi:hypothetical protein
MGMIESIRNRQTLLLTLIGLGMLSFLIPYDAVIALMGNTATSQAAGSVNGEDISFLEYRTKVQERNGLFNYTDNRAAQNEVWSDIVSERLYGDEFEDLGLALTKEEFDDIRYGDFVSPWVSRTFYGGQVDEQKKEEWRQSFSTMYNNPEGRKSYEGYAGIISQKRMREKFDGLVKAGLAANTLEGKREFLRAQEKVDFRYVLKAYTSTPDDEVEVTDRDLRAYYAAHKNDTKYAQRAGRDIEYVRIKAPESTVKCRHILLKTDDVNDPDQLAALEARADSLKLRLEAGDVFADLVEKHSEDPGSKATGGEYEFGRGRMVESFEEFCFDNPVGTIGTAQTNYGLHLIEVLDQNRVTGEQISEVEQLAKNMAINCSTTEELRVAADTLGYAIVEARDIQSGAQGIAGSPDAGEIVAWAFGAEPSEVSKQYKMNGDYIIATLIRVKEAGGPPFENVEEQMRAGAIEDKKAEMYMELMVGSSLEDIAEKADAQVKTTAGVSLKTPSISGAGGGTEPDVVGAAFSLPINEVSSPIQGANGVWVISPTVRNPVEASGSFASEVNTLNDRTYFRNLPQTSGSPVRLSAAIEAKAEVKDLRQGS